MEITHIGKGLGILGIGTILISIVQWMFLYPDKSQLVIGTAIGTIFVGFAYLHCWMRQTESNHRDLNEGLDALNIWIHDEFEKRDIKKKNEKK